MQASEWKPAGARVNGFQRIDFHCADLLLTARSHPLFNVGETGARDYFPGVTNTRALHMGEYPYWCAPWGQYRADRDDNSDRADVRSAYTVVGGSRVSTLF